MSEYGQPNPPQFQPPKKRRTVRNVVLVATIGILFVIGSCTALIGGAGQAAKAPVDVTSKAVPVDNGPTPDPVITPTNKPSPKVTHHPAPTTTKPTAPAMTASQEQAIGSAESYLSVSAFSRKGLIHQLSSEYGEGFSVKDATFAVDHIAVNWNEQAAKKAQEYLSMQHFSRKGLIHQLESAYGEQFTHKQAVYGVTKAGL